MALCNSGKNVLDENVFDNGLIDFQTIADAANSKSLTASSRLTGSVRTLQGRLQQIAGYQPLNGGVWAAGITFNGYDEFMIYNSAAYKVKPASTLPILTTAVPDLNDFEPFTLISTKDEVYQNIDDYNTTELGDFTDYVFRNADDMIVGLTVGGKTVTFKEGQALKINGENNEISCYIVDTIPPGIPLDGGLYAREVFARIVDEAGGVNDPLAALDPLNDARNYPKPNLTTVGTGVGGSTNKYGGGVLSQENKIYAMPNQGGQVMKFDISAGTYSNLGDTVISGQGYRSGALASNGNIYAASVNGSNILKIDTSSDAVSEIAGLNVSNIGFDGVVAGDDGLLYFVPASATRVVQFNPITESVTYIGSTFSLDPAKWAGGCIGPNGKIYCAPHDDANILEIDTATAQTRLIPTSSSAAFARWKGCVVGKDGLIYFMPYDDERVMVYDHSSDTVSYMAQVVAGSNKFVGGVLGFNGRIYAMPYNSDELMEINTDNQELNFYFVTGAASATKYHGGVSTVDGVIYGMPSNGSANTLVIDGIEGQSRWQISAYSNKY